MVFLRRLRAQMTTSRITATMVRMRRMTAPVHVKMIVNGRSVEREDSVSRSLNQSIINQPINQPINQSTNQLTFIQPINQSTNQMCGSHV